MKARHRTDPQKTLVGFAVGDLPYAIDIGRVIQIVNPLPLSELPHLPEGVIGVADYRGDVVPVIDLRTRFGLPREASTRRTKWVLVSLGHQSVALVVDSVSDVFGTAGAELRPPPGIGGEDRRNIMGVTTHDGRLTFVLDVIRLRSVVESLSLPQRGLPSSPAPRASIGPKA